MKGVQCYELFVGIALKKYAFFLHIFTCSPDEGPGRTNVFLNKIDGIEVHGVFF